MPSMFDRFESINYMIYFCFIYRVRLDFFLKTLVSHSFYIKVEGNRPQ